LPVQDAKSPLIGTFTDRLVRTRDGWRFAERVGGLDFAAVTEPTLLSGGNPQIAKADGDAPVQAYIAAMPGWKSGLGRRLDSIIERAVPGVTKAVKWNSPFYGVEGQGWFPQLSLLHPLREGDVLHRRLAETAPARQVQERRGAHARHSRGRRPRRGAAGRVGPPGRGDPGVAGLMAVNGCIPIVPSADLERSLKLWREGLGFDETWWEQHRDGVLVGCGIRKGAMTFMLNIRVGDPAKPEDTKACASTGRPMTFARCMRASRRSATPSRRSASATTGRPSLS
jgi:hypothetical protein